MIKSQTRPTDDEIVTTLNEYSDMLFKLCFAMLGNYADAEDAVSEAIIRYIEKSPEFSCGEHKKAWLLRVASNICKDKLRFSRHRNFVNLEEIYDLAGEEADRKILECLVLLPEKYKTVIYLFYIEGYKTKEIAEILKISEAAVRKRLQYGREKLKLEYEKE